MISIPQGGGAAGRPARPGPGPEEFLKEMPMGIPEGNAFKDPFRKCRCGNLLQGNLLSGFPIGSGGISDS